MKIALLFGPWSLSFRKNFDFETLWDDRRGLTGSEMGFVCIARELKTLGHDVELVTVSSQREWMGMPVLEWGAHLDRTRGEYDAVISINEPDSLRGVNARVRVCEFWLNDFTFCKVGFQEHVDLFVSPSEAHLAKTLSGDWKDVEITPDGPKATYAPDPSRWVANRLGCDVERYPETEKIPGRVVYCSSPDRGLHWVLQEWPKIKRAAPHASLHIFYRLREWIDGFDHTPYFPPIERLRSRANYIDEALTRLAGMDVVVRDSVSRREIEREMSLAEVLAYPCDTTSWSEGFSCTVLEACAARACPVISDCDALGTLYRGACSITRRASGWVEPWGFRVIEALTNHDLRRSWNYRARAFAEEHTWKAHTERLLVAIESRLRSGTEIRTESSGTCSPAAATLL